MIDHGLRAERTFLALCIALPQDGEEALAAIDPDGLLSSELYRRAARHLAGRTGTPLSDLPPEDEELAKVMAELVALAGRGTNPTRERLNHARLWLELGRVDRALARARATGTGGIGDLAREREHVRSEIHGVVARMESTV